MPPNLKLCFQMQYGDDDEDNDGVVVADDADELLE